MDGSGWKTVEAGRPPPDRVPTAIPDTGPGPGLPFPEVESPETAFSSSASSSIMTLPPPAFLNLLCSAPLALGFGVVSCGTRTHSLPSTLTNFPLTNIGSSGSYFLQILSLCMRASKRGCAGSIHAGCG